MGVYEKSLAAPTSFQEYPKHMVIGDYFVKYILITALPGEFDFGILSYYVSDPNIKVYMTTKQLGFDITKSLNKEYRDKEQNLEKTSDPELRIRLRTELETLQIHLEDIVASKDKVLDVFLVFVVMSDSLEDLNSLSYELKRSL